MKKKPLERTKVVIRHLPPSLSQFHLFSQFDHLFSHRYNWYCFRPGKYSQKHQRYSRAYIDFKSPGDVLEFAEFFHGHIFINEKGAQFKAIVEYAPSQKIPRCLIMKDIREGTIYEDPDYLEFLKLIAEPAETLPSAEAQLERKEAQQSGSAKEIPIITPLMEFVRQKRSAAGGKQDPSVACRHRKRAGSASMNKPSSCADKQCAEKKKDILNRSTKKANRKGKSTNIQAPRQEDRLATLGGKKNQKLNAVPGGILKQPGNSPVSTASKPSGRFTASVRSIKGILLNNEAHKNRPLTSIQPRDKIQNSNLEHDKLLGVPMNKQVGFNSYPSCSEPSQAISDGNVKSTSDRNFSTKNQYSAGSASKRREKRTRNKDRTNHGVRSPLSLSCIHHDNGEKSSSTLQHTGLLPKPIEGFHKHGHHGPTSRTKKDGSLIASEQRSSKRGVANGYAVHQKQVWVQKSSSAS